MHLEQGHLGAVPIFDTIASFSTCRVRVSSKRTRFLGGTAHCCARLRMGAIRCRTLKRASMRAQGCPSRSCCSCVGAPATYTRLPGRWHTAPRLARMAPIMQRVLRKETPLCRLVGTHQIPHTPDGSERAR